MAKILLTNSNNKSATSPRGAGLGALVSTIQTHSSVFNKPEPAVDIILQNKMAVNNLNYSVMNGMNTTQAATSKPIKLDPRGSDNFSNSQTKFTHSVLDEEKQSTIFPPSVKSAYKAIPMKGKKYKKGRKFLPSLFDDNMLSPRDYEMPNGSSDFKRPLFKNIKDYDAGYDTEVNAERAEALKFGFTDEGRFGGYDSVQGNRDKFQESVFSQTQKLKRKKANLKAKMLLTEERKHKYAKSVTHSA